MSSGNAETAGDGGGAPEPARRSAVEAEQRREIGAHGALLVALLLILLHAAMESSLPFKGVIYDTLLTVLFLACVYSVGRRPRTLVIALLIAVPAILVHWIEAMNPNVSWRIADILLSGTFLLFATGTTLHSVLRASDVTLDTILGGITAYLLIGVFFAVLFMGLEFIEPGTLVRDGQAISQHRPSDLSPPMVYFSFVTLTTLGFGDIAPTTDVSRILAVVEAIIGQLYIAILIASLVAKRISQVGRASGR